MSSACGGPIFRTVIEVVKSFVFATKCEVVPFWVETILISYENYGGYIYFSKSSDLPTTVGVHCQLLPTLANSCQLLVIAVT